MPLLASSGPEPFLSQSNRPLYLPCNGQASKQQSPSHAAAGNGIRDILGAAGGQLHGCAGITQAHDSQPLSMFGQAMAATADPKGAPQHGAGGGPGPVALFAVMPQANELSTSWECQGDQGGCSVAGPSLARWTSDDAWVLFVLKDRAQPCNTLAFSCSRPLLLMPTKATHPKSCQADPPCLRRKHHAD